MGYTLLLKELSRFDTENILPILQTLLSRHVDGIVWAVPQVGDNHCWVDAVLSEIPIPIVFLTMEKRPNLSIVHYDNYLGGKMATEHLLEQGYRRIGHITGPLDWWESRQRKAGWQDALAAGRDRGRKKPLGRRQLVVIMRGTLPFANCWHNIRRWTQSLSANDQMALSVLQISCREGVGIPAQLGVVGFDGLAETPYYWPPLTTVVQDQHLLGCTAVEEIVRAIEKTREDDMPSWLQDDCLNPGVGCASKFCPHVSV